MGLLLVLFIDMLECIRVIGSDPPSSSLSAYEKHPSKFYYMFSYVPYQTIKI